MSVRSTFYACDSDSFVYKHELGKLSPRHHHAVNMVYTTDIACGRVLYTNRFVNFCYGRLWNMSSQLRHVLTIGKKLVKQQYLPHMFSQYGELRPTSS